MKRYRLNDFIPLSDEELGAKGIAILISTILLGLLYWSILEPGAGTMPDPKALTINWGKQRIPDPSYVSPFLMTLLVFMGLLVMNFSVFKLLPGFLQYLICCGFGLWFTRYSIALDSYVLILIKALIYGGMIFILFRVNWWFYWDNPSRRTTLERMVLSILYTSMPLIGLPMGLYRLVGIGVEASTTEFIVDSEASGGVLEQVPPDPRVEEHARRVAAARNQSRVNPRNKDANSESI